MTNTFSLGKEKFGQIDFDRLKSGITKQELGIEEGTVLSSIFDSIDTSDDENSKGKLDRQELNKFLQIIKDLVGKDENLSEKEASKYKINGEKFDKTGKELLKFISKLSDLTQNVTGIEETEISEVINYGNGKTEEIFKDGSKFVKVTNGNESVETLIDTNGHEIQSSIIKNGVVVSNTFTTYDENGVPKERERYSQGNTYRGHETGTHETHSIEVLDKEGRILYTRESTSKMQIGNDSYNSYYSNPTNNGKNEVDIRIKNGFYEYQKKTDENGNVTAVEYDEQGCMQGYYIQDGETVESIAQKFGIDKKLLIAANPGSKFIIMEKIRIPKQFDIDDPVLQERKSKQEIWDNAKKITGHYSNGDDEFVVINSKLKHGWRGVISKDGTIEILDKNNKVLSEEAIAEQLAWDEAPKTKAIIPGNYSKNIEPKVVTVAVVQKSIKNFPGCSVVRDRDGNIYVKNKYGNLCDPNDSWSYSEHINAKKRTSAGDYSNESVVVIKEIGHGKKVVQDRSGKNWIMDANGILLDEEEAAKAQYVDKVKDDPATAMKTAISIVRQQLNSAIVAFNKQKREEGWTAKVADAVSILWGSENRAEKVIEDLNKYSKQLEQLERCLKNNDIESFKSVFYNMFQKDFNQNSLANYIEKPTSDNYINAFGTKNDIGLRVAKYSESQNVAGNWVKVGGEVVIAGLATTAAVITAPIPGVDVATSGLAYGTIAAAVATATVGFSDRLSSDVGLREGDVESILKESAWSGAGALAGGVIAKGAGAVIKGASKCAAAARATVDITGNIAVGAVTEYAQTGTVTVEGTVMGAVLPLAVTTAGAVGKRIKTAIKGSATSESQVATKRSFGIGDQASGEPIVGKMKGIDPSLAETEAHTTKSQGRTSESPEIVSKKKKSISEMSNEELLSEHNRMYKETSEHSIDKNIKLENIKQMKLIEEQLKVKGLKIEQGKLVTIQKPQIKSSETTTQDSHTLSKTELKNKLGKNLFNLHEMIENSIEKLETIADYTRLKNVIITKFKDFSDVMANLLNKLEEKAKQIGLNIVEGVEDLVSIPADLTQRLGNKLSNLHTKILTAIESLSTEKQFNKIAKSIQKHFSEFDDIMSDLIKKLTTKSEQIGLKTSTTTQKITQNVNVKCYPNQPIKIDSNTHIRLANSIDINLKDIETKLNLMKDGDSFKIGREVTGNNDIKITNEHVSAEHIMIYKKNGEFYIIDLSSSNGTVLNTTKPNSVAEWNPNLREKFANGNADTYYDILEKNYSDIREAKYSYKESVNSNISDKNIEIYQTNISPYIDTVGYGGWSFRSPKNLPKNANQIYNFQVDRISLNVKADKNLLLELDRFIATGEYVNSNGQTVKVNVPVSKYKTPQKLSEWTERHDPITMYFSEKITPEVENAIAEIAQKYSRPSSNGKELMNSVEGKPWMAKEAYISEKQAQSLYLEAKSLNKELAISIEKWAIEDNNFNWSTGMYASMKKLVDEYKLAIGLTKDPNQFVSQISHSRQMQYSSYPLHNNQNLTCTPYTRIKVSINDKIRLADCVDIDLKDLQYKFNSMKEGESFTIGRNVNGNNNLRLNNEKISAQHLRVEKINGEIYITDLSSTNGTVINTIKPDYAAKWTPKISSKYKNASVQQFNYLFEENYSNLRHARYSINESISNNINEKHLQNSTKYSKMENSNNPDFYYRSPKRMGNNYVGAKNCVERMSLNVKADKKLLEELDQLFEKGQYINKDGKKITISPQNVTYKTPKTLNDWTTRHDPITLYFDKNVTPEMQHAIIEITEKYARKSSNGKTLMNGIDGVDWVAKESNVKPESAKKLYEEAYRLNPNLAKAIAANLGYNSNWNCSTGYYAAAEKLVNEYKLLYV